MVEGVWIAIIGMSGVVIGAALGVLGSIYATRVRLKGSKDYFDDRATKFLVAKFNGHADGLGWEEIYKHGTSIGLKEEDTKILLLMADIEPTDETGNHWKPITK